MNAWNSEPDQSLLDLAARAASLSTEELTDALRLDQSRRWWRGQPLPVEAYLDLFPAVRNLEDVVLDLIYNEVFHRQDQGDRPDREEYERRFPALAPKFQFLFALQEVMGEPTGGVRSPGESTAPATGG